MLPHSEVTVGNETSCDKWIDSKSVPPPLHNRPGANRDWFKMSFAGTWLPDASLHFLEGFSSASRCRAFPEQCSRHVYPHSPSRISSYAE